MMRTKAKGLLVGVMLLIACCVFFACKEQTKIKVDSIAFTEQSISLLVGEEYTPKVKVLPSYATSRSYTLISNDTTALAIEGGTITALKAAMGVKLKVVSDEDENINDILSVNIYNEATELETPTELMFDGTKFTFVGKDNVNNYVLKVNGKEINIGNNTEYNIANIIDKVGEIYDDVVTCSVKASGDGKIFKDSPYSENISFVKLSSVSNIYVENETLYFNAIKNVASYTVEILAEGQEIQSKIVNNTSFNEKQLSLDITELTDSVNGCNYVIKVTPNSENYNLDVDVFEGTAVELNYAVVGKVQNIIITEKVISWNFVQNAQTYTIQIYKDGELLQEFSNIVTNQLEIPYNEEGEYSCKIIANSTNANTTTGKEYSSLLNFAILPSPELNIDDNLVTWSNVTGAEGYLITIKDSAGAMLLNQKFIITNSYDVSNFSAGKYYVELIACGNGENGQNQDAQVLLSSKVSNQATWTILQGVQVKIENQKLYWQDADASSLNKYRVKFDDVDIVLTSADYGIQYQYDATTNMFSYDLSGHNFAPSTYTVSVQSIGENNIFDAEINNINMIKLAESSISSLSNKQFTISPVTSAVSYKIEIYKADDLNNVIVTLNTRIGYNFTLDASVLEAGAYVAKVFTYGNNTLIFDADNSSATTHIAFEKLATPTIDVDKDNLKLVIDKNNIITSENKYNLFENNRNKNIVGDEYDLSGLTAGDYVYAAQAIGDNATILDSDVTISENEVKVKKLTTPNISFDKESLNFTISCIDDSYVDSYTFTLNEKNIAVTNYIADCSADIEDPGIYEAKVYANPQSVSAGYGLVIASNYKTHTVSKLAGLCDFQLSSGNLIVTPAETLSGSGYSLSLYIDNGENDIVLDRFTYTNSRFEMSLYDSKYNVIEAIKDIMQGAGEYSLFTTISQNDDNVVTSNETQCVNALKVLGKVTTITKNAQTIEFNSVANATNYIAVVEVNGTEYYIDIAGKYTTSANNVITIQDLLQLMEVVRVPYLEQTEYNISFVAVNEDTHTIDNKGINKYSFEFLKTPTLSVVEQDGNSKYLAIANEDDNASSYYVVISQDMVFDERTVTKQAGENTLINMDSLTQLVAGNVIVYVTSLASSGDYFNSQTGEVDIVKLDSSEITIANGLLEWNTINNSKQYNLVYSNASGSGTVVLTEGSDNFNIQGGKCIYNFDTLASGVSSLYLQVDSQVEDGNRYYLNSNNGPTFDSVYKLATPIVSVVNGEIYTEISNLDLGLVKKIEIRIDDVELFIDIRTEQEGVSIYEDVDKKCITISPNILFKYGVDELLLETISLKLYSNDSQTLNSSVGSKNVYGLLSPTNLDITTSETRNDNGVVDEIIEKITWDNHEANLNIVSKYEILINYNSIDYIFNSSERAFMMPTYHDANNNGIFDSGEIEFGAGVYNIKVKSLTDDCVQYVNSKYCSEITVTVLSTPTSLAVSGGNVIWSSDTNVGYYLVKVYMMNGAKESLLVSTQSSISGIDLTTLTPFETGVYGVSVQAMHDASRILASKESDILQVVRLPQVEEYYIKDGALYIRMHKFFSKAEVVLTDKDTGATSYKFTISNEDSNNNVMEYVKNGLYKTWAVSNIIDTYTDDNYLVDIKYMLEDDATLRMALAEDYSLSVKLFGNTLSLEDLDLPIDGVNIGSIISGHTSEDAINTYYKDNASVIDKNILEKLVTPTIEVSPTERGVVLVDIPNGLNYALKYYVDGTNSLQGVHLYEVNISTDNTYTLYVAEIVDKELFEASIDGTVIQDGADKNNLKHFEYNGITFNVIEQNAQGYIAFNFNTAKYYYYTSSGNYSDIDLTKGGSFVVNVRFMGDDTIFAQSNITDIVTIKRYNVLNLTINNGVMSWLNQATIDDHPIYLITLSSKTETYNLVLYNPDVEYAEGLKYTEEYLLNCLESGKTYIFDTITYSLDAEVQDATIIYKGLADIIAKARQTNGTEVGLGGTFLATIKAHYTDTTSTDVILAQGGESKTIAILPQSQISVIDGTLSWNMSYVTNTGGREYISNYLLQVFNGKDKLYEITLASNMYNVTNYVATYQLPQVINNGSDGDFTFTAGANYTFNLIALGGDSNTYINSISSTTGEISILPNLEDVKMENGVLTWTNSTTNSVEVYITYMLGDATVKFVTTENDNVFELPTSFTDTSGTLRHLVAGYDYNITVRLKGQTESLNSFFSEEFVAQRLATIDNNSIVTTDGVLTWSPNANYEGVKYSVFYILEDGTTEETEMLDSNSFDFAGFDSGKIKVKVFAHHNSHFTSFASSTNDNGDENASKLVEIYKLEIPTNIKKHEGETIISWNTVMDANGETVENYRVSIQQEGVETKEYNCDTNEWIISGVVSHAFSIAVKAISVDASGAVINSDYSSYYSMELPNQVDVNTFIFDTDLQAFKWKAIVGEQYGDKYYIGYNYYNAILTEGSTALPSPVTDIEVTETKTIEGEKYYYYYPSMIGSYRLIYVQVKRAESLSSQQTWYTDDNINGIDFDIFSSGEGTTVNPYILDDERELRNIKYRLDAQYELDADITLTSSLPITDSSQVFTGTINGQTGGVSHYINGFKSEQTVLFEKDYVGLFARVQDATFANIILSGFSLSGYVNSQTVYISILAGEAKHSTFQNITITDSTIELIKSTTIGYISNNANMYVGVISGYAQDCTFTACEINLGGSEANIIADITGNSNTKLAVGGIAGYADNCSFVNNTSNENNAFIISILSTIVGGTPTEYVGALVGEVGNNGVNLNGESNSGFKASRIDDASFTELYQTGNKN